MITESPPFGLNLLQPASIELSSMKKERSSFFTKQFKKDLTYWSEVNPKMAVKVREMVKAIEQDPFTGIGKPEPLKWNLQGLWSRRLTEEDRILYEVLDDRINFIKCRKHY
jgi:toxin YoeB